MTPMSPDNACLMGLLKIFGFGAVLLRLQYIDVLSLFHNFFAMFNNVVHSLEPGETPSNSASHQAPNYVQRS